MKSTGIVRHIDNLGRITLPIELRKTLDMACGDPLEIYTEGNSVILRKHEASCVFCGSNKKVTLEISDDEYLALSNEALCNFSLELACRLVDIGTNVPLIPLFIPYFLVVLLVEAELCLCKILTD